VEVCEVKRWCGGSIGKGERERERERKQRTEMNIWKEKAAMVYLAKIELRNFYVTSSNVIWK
jgi:hypothetical protein